MCINQNERPLLQRKQWRETLCMQLGQFLAGIIFNNNAFSREMYVLGY